MSRLVTFAALLCAMTASYADGMRQVWLGTPFLEGWVPEDAEAIRGVSIMNGFSNYGTWDEACGHWDFAIIRVNMDGYFDEKLAGPDTPLKNFTAQSTAVIYATEELARRTGHEEITWAPIVTSGFSRFSPSAPLWQETFRSRALAWMNGQNGSGMHKKSGETNPLWQEVPNLGMYNEWENIFSGGNKNQLTPGAWWKRQAKNLSMASIHWRVYHNPTTHPDIGIIFLDRVIKHRIPANWNPKSGPADLKPVKLEDGWIGDMQSWHVETADIPSTNAVSNNNVIMPYAEYKGDADQTKLTSWFIDENLAWAWRAYSTRYEEARLISPGFAAMAFYDNPSQFAAPVGNLETGLVAGQPFEMKVINDTYDITKIEFYVDTKKVAEVKASEFTGGDIALGSSQNSYAAAQVTVDAPGVHALMAKWYRANGTEGWSHHVPAVVQSAD